MPYAINKYDGTQVTVVVDGTVDNTLAIKLIGRNYAGYGEIQNENFLFLLENFAGSNQPRGQAVAGQLWYDTSLKKLKAYDGARYRTLATADQSTVAPANATTGDFWFDTDNEQLYVWSNDQFLLVGPEGIPGYGITKLRSRLVKDTPNGVRHPIIEAVIDDVPVFIVNKDQSFTIDRTEHPLPDLDGFTDIRRGITLVNSSNNSLPGQTTSDHRFWGTTSNAERLGGFPANLHIRSDSATFTSTVRFDNTGFTVGVTPSIQVLSENNVPAIKTLISNRLLFKTRKTESTVDVPLQLVGPDILPGENNTTDIGSANLKIKTIYADTVDATSLRSQTLSVGGDFRSASSVPSSGTIVARTSADELAYGIQTTAGSIKATYFIGVATSAAKLEVARTINGIPFNGTTDIVVADETKVSKDGDTMTGFLTLHANPTSHLHAATKNYVDTATGSLDAIIQHATQALNDAIAAAEAALNHTIETAKAQLQQAIDDAVGPKVIRSGDTMTGFLTLHADPTQNLHAATKRYVDTTVDARVPRGIITMWYGVISNIPTGWSLCNGSNGTPDLRDRFVVGAGSTYTTASTGGSASSSLPAHTHTTPSHSHSLSGTGTTNSAGNHTHTVSDPGHAHSITFKRDTVTGTSGNAVYGDEIREGFSNENTNSATTGISIANAGDHSHTFTLSGASTEGGAGTTSSAGTSSSNGNLPPYYALAYIMKL